MLLSTALAALSLLATISPVDAASGSSLHRRRCRASHGIAGGAINVGSKPTSSPDDEPAQPKPSSPPTGAPAPAPAPSGCFPSAGFDVPNSPSGISLDDWWCPRSSEYAFMGFSMAVNGCPDKGSLTSSFRQMKNQFNARYVRLYGACDRGSFNDDLIDAAYESGIGIFYLVWFGFEGGDQWKNRLNGILNEIDSNPRAPYVIRSLTLGSEPLFDHAITAGNLVDQINRIRGRIGGKGIDASTSEMPHLLNENRNVINTVDSVQLNSLAYFAGDATFGGAAGPRVTRDIETVANATGNKKKIYITQTGWPTTDEIWKPNSRSAVTSVGSSKAYYDALDDLCPTFKRAPVGGVGWFAHIWSDEGLPGWGITRGGQAKFDFSPRIRC